MLKKARKRRSDRNYLVYTITNQVTGDQYIGITVRTQTVFRTLRRRIQKHVQRALAEPKDWALSQNIRTYGAEAFTFGFVEQIRGRRPAYQRERELIRAYQPALNTF